MNRVDWDVFPYDSDVDDDDDDDDDTWSMMMMMMMINLTDTLGDTDSEVKNALKTFRKNNIDKTIFAHFSISSLRNKFDQLSDMIKGNTEVLMISESKPDKSFPDGQFLIEGYGASLNRNKLWGGIMLFVRILTLKASFSIFKKTNDYKIVVIILKIVKAVYSNL